MKKLVKTFWKPTVLTTDKALSLLYAFKKLKNNVFYVYTKSCIVRHFNNLIEQDHRHNLHHASHTLKRIETIHALYKRNLSFSAHKKLRKLLVAT